MIDATIVIPTFRHAALLPYALESALDQDGASVEVFVVGDGVEDDTRAAARALPRRRTRALLRLPEGRAARRAQPPRGTRRGERTHRLLPVGRRSSPSRARRGDGPSSRERGLRSLGAVRRDAGRVTLVRADRHLTARVPDAAPARRLERDRADGSRAHPRRLPPAAATAGGRRRSMSGPTSTCGSSSSVSRASAALPALASRTCTFRTRRAVTSRWQIASPSSSAGRRGSAAELRARARASCGGRAHAAATRGEARTYELEGLVDRMQSTRWWRLRVRLAT